MISNYFAVAWAPIVAITGSNVQHRDNEIGEMASAMVFAGVGGNIGVPALTLHRAS